MRTSLRCTSAQRFRQTRKSHGARFSFPPRLFASRRRRRKVSCTASSAASPGPSRWAAYRRSGAWWRARSDAKASRSPRRKRCRSSPSLGVANSDSTRSDRAPRSEHWPNTGRTLAELWPNLCRTLAELLDCRSPPAFTAFAAAREDAETTPPDARRLEGVRGRGDSPRARPRSAGALGRGDEPAELPQTPGDGGRREAVPRRIEVVVERL